MLIVLIFFCTLDHFVKVCDDDKSEDILDAIGEEAGEDDDKFRELLTAKINAL
mgnify:CR=1 FL=1